MSTGVLVSVGVAGIGTSGRCADTDSATDAEERVGICSDLPVSGASDLACDEVDAEREGRFGVTAVLDEEDVYETDTKDGAEDVKGDERVDAEAGRLTTEDLERETGLL